MLEAYGPSRWIDNHRMFELDGTSASLRRIQDVDPVLDTIRPETAPDHVPPAHTTNERELFAALFEAEAPIVLRYARSRVGDGPAEDIVADTFIAAWRSAERYDEDLGTQRAWLLGIATKMLARHRDAERRWLHGQTLAADLTNDRSDAAGNSAESEVVDLEGVRARDQQLRRALVRMSPRLRDPLMLHELAGLSYEEISSALRIPVGTVRSRMSRARTKLEEARSNYVQ